MFGFLSQIPSLFGKGLATVGSGIASGAKTLGRGVGKLPSRLGAGDDAMLRTPDFVSTGGRAMPDFKPPVQSGGMTDLLYRGTARDFDSPMMRSFDKLARFEAPIQQGAGQTFSGDTALAAPNVRSSAAPSALPTRNIGARDTLTNIARAENPMLEQAPQYQDPIRQARDTFVNERLNGGRSRWKQIAIPALLGAASQGASGDWGRMLGGAIGGAGMGTFAPKQALQGEYEMREGGRDREELGREQEWQKAQATLANMRSQQALRESQSRAAQEKARLDAEAAARAEARAEAAFKTKEELDRLEIKRREKDLAAPEKLTSVAPGATLYDPVTGKEVYRAPDRPQSYTEQMKDAEAQLDADEGTVDKIARDSTEARREEIMRRLPAAMQTILSGGMVKDSQLKEKKGADGRGTGEYEAIEFERPATLSEIDAARRAYQAEYDKLLKQNIDYTTNIRKRGVQQRVQQRMGGGGQRPAGGGSRSGGSIRREEASKRYNLPPSAFNP